MDRQPEWILLAQALIMISMQPRTKSFVCSDLDAYMIRSKGLRNTRWKLKFDSSSFCKNFRDSCFRESMAYMANA